MKVFLSKIDPWVVVVLTLTLVICSFSFVCSVVTHQNDLILISLPGLIIGIGLPIWLVKGTYYVIDDMLLIVRGGPFTWRVPIKDIRSITPTRSFLSSPALSLDRLRIDYGLGRSVMISPKLKEEFLHEIETRRRAGNP